MTNTEKCRWNEQPEDLMVWDIEWLTACGGSFGLDREEGKPSENDYRYCPKCGKLIEEVPIVREDEA